jgi:hypothetical protein
MDQTFDPYEPPSSAVHERELGLTSGEKTSGLIAHLGAGIGNFLGGWGIVVPLVILLIKKDESPFAARHAKESLNFQISMWAYFFVSIPLCLILVGFLGMIAFGILAIVMPIIAGIKANDGGEYRYPLTFRLIT